MHPVSKTRWFFRKKVPYGVWFKSTSQRDRATCGFGRIIRSHRKPGKKSTSGAFFSSPNPGPMFALITARILIADRISRALSELSFDVMAKSIIPLPIFGRPAWSSVEVGRLAHKERASWAERRLTGQITELNQRMWRVTQRLDLETSRCAPVPSRPNSSLVAAHCARTWTDLRTCVDRAGLERSDFAVRRVPLISAWK